MKPQEVKNEFIRLRAEGQSYSKISKALNISKSTCTSWNKEFKTAIASLKQEQLADLYNAYHITKEARIKKLGRTLDNIETALDNVDLEEIPAEKLLEYKLKYMEALKEEYISPVEPYEFTSEELEPKDIVEALNDLLARVRAGDITAEQARQETAVLTNLLKAYDIVEVKDKVTVLENILGGRD